ncbi:homocitrate synthase [Inquilinus sp.]|uniref:homocitrate synthase/isopropylmalate synthase family protein n=1 Tax=Inquilinus sp. TaxID=1932117 RepID=UPI0031E39D5D
MTSETRKPAAAAGKPLWMTSPFHHAASSDLRFAETVRVADCTLRDGEQQAGVVFTAAEKLAIARELDALGVYEIEAGTPSVSPQDCEALAAIVDAGLTAKVSALALARRQDIDLVKGCGAWAVRLSLPIGYLQREAKLKLDDEAYLQKAIEVTSYARELGLNVIFSPYDTTRCDMAFLLRVVEELTARGTVDRIRLVDTAGCATPQAIGHLVREVKKATPVPLEVHCHNDFGLAVANTIAGAAAGAEYLSVTMNGIGERSGNASLEEVAVALFVLYGVDLGLDTTMLTGLSRLVEELSGVPLQRHKAIVGRNSFAHESGTVVAGVLKQPFTAEPFVPDLVGQTREIVLGKKSGAASIDVKLSQLGYTVTDAQRDALLKRVKDEAVRTKSAVSEAALIAMVDEVLAS